MKKTGLTVLSVLLVLSLLTVSVFAAGSTAEKQGLCAWLQNADNTGFDYSETSLPTAQSIGLHLHWREVSQTCPLNTRLILTPLWKTCFRGFIRLTLPALP